MLFCSMKILDVVGRGGGELYVDVYRAQICNRDVYYQELNIQGYWCRQVV